MRYRADVLLLNSDQVDVPLGEFDSATEARKACSRYSSSKDTLVWHRLWDGVWTAHQAPPLVPGQCRSGLMWILC